MTVIRTDAEAAALQTELLYRIHWGAVFAGAVCALAALIVLNLIGISIGAYILDPAQPNADLAAAATATGVWWVVSALAALFAGGWVAGRLAGVDLPITAAMHGAVVWALATILAVWMVSAGVRGAFMGAASVVGDAAEAAGTAAGGAPRGAAGDAAAQPVLGFVTGQLREELDRAGAAAPGGQIQGEAERIVAEAVTPEERRQIAENLRSLAADAARSPGDVQVDFNAFVRSTFGPGGVIGPEDESRAAQAIAERLGLPPNEAQAVVARWRARVSGAGAEAQQGVAALREGLGEAASEAADTVAGAALWTALGLLLALAAAAFGGVLGRPHTGRA